MQHARSATAAFCSASRRRLLVNRLIVAVAIFFAIQALFVAGSLQHSAQRVVTVVVAIVVNVSSMILVAVDVVASPIIATRDLALGVIGAAIIGGVTHLAMEVSAALGRRRFFNRSNS